MKPIKFEALELLPPYDDCLLCALFGGWRGYLLSVKVMRSICDIICGELCSAPRYESG